jgi:hypothetical protein
MGIVGQYLRWWHGMGVQEIKIQGVRRDARELLVAGKGGGVGGEEGCLGECKGGCSVA